MVWAKLDDEILDNEKISNAGVLGFAMHVAAITWCCRKLTDGFVPRARVRLLLDLSTLGAEFIEATDQPEGIKDRACGTLYDLGDAQADRIAAKLVSVGLWREDAERGGFWIHDFLEYNPSKEEADAAREAKATSGKKGAAARWGSKGPKASAPMASAKAVAMAPAIAAVMAPAMAPPMANGWQIDAPDPDPDPVPKEIQDPPSRAGADSQVRSKAKPEWVAAELEGVSADTGETFDGPIVWLTYQANRESQSKTVSPADFRRFLGSWASRQKSDRINARDRPAPQARGRNADRQPHDEGWLRRLREREAAEGTGTDDFGGGK